MAAVVEQASVRDRLSALLRGGVVRAALFSSFTFNRSYFEQQIFQGLLVPNSGGAGLGQFPVTVVLDASQYRGSARGYDVMLSHGRLWHAKVICLMVGSAHDACTILLVGSGNLTPSGWESNLELFRHETLKGWVLPKGVEELFASKQLPARDSAFMRWFRAAGTNHAISRAITRRYISSAKGIPIWRQWDWEGAWSTAYVVSPFLDNGVEEGARKDEGAGQFFEALESRASGGNKSLWLFLRDAGKDNGAVVAPWKTIQSLVKRFDLHVLRCTEGGPLHAKLFAVRQGKLWHVLGGSPNASGMAMVRESGNVELAWQWETLNSAEVKLLLPDAREVAIARDNFVEPEFIRSKSPWSAVERAVYGPRSQKLEIHWRKGYGTFDTELLWGNQKVADGQRVRKPGEDRALQMRPRKLEHRGQFRNGWIPIEWPSGSSDSRELDPELSFLELLAVGGADSLLEKPEREGNGPLTRQKLSSAQVKNNVFPWKARVDKLRSALDRIEDRLKQCSSLGTGMNQESDYHCRLVERMFESAHNECRTLRNNDLEYVFREWAKVELLDWSQNLDRRTRSSKQMRKLSRGWAGRIHKLLR